MRYYLDTNILVFLISNNDYEIHPDVRDIVSDFSNTLNASSIAINELILLYKTGKIRLRECKSAQDVLDKISLFGIEIVYYNKHHLSKYVELDLADEHKDVNDHAIIAQSISDKVPLISSDAKFHHYAGQGLSFVFNKR